LAGEISPEIDAHALVANSGYDAFVDVQVTIATFPAWLAVHIRVAVTFVAPGQIGAISMFAGMGVLETFVNVDFAIFALPPRGADTTIIGFPSDAFAANGGAVSVVAFVVFAKVDFLLASGAREASRTVANRFPAQCSVRLTVILTLVAWAVVRAMRAAPSWFTLAGI